MIQWSCWFIVAYMHATGNRSCSPVFIFASVAAKVNYIFRTRPFWNLNNLWTPKTDFSGFPVLMKPGLCFRPNDTHGYIWWILRVFHVFLPSLAGRSCRARYSIYLYIYKCRADHWWKHPWNILPQKHVINKKVSKFEPLGTSVQALKKKREQIFCRCRRSWAVSNGHRLCHQIVAIQGAIGETNEATSLVGSEQFNEMSLPLDPSKPWFICF